MEKYGGLTVNVSKTKLFFGKDVTVKNQASRILGVQSGSLYIKYLEVPLSANKHRISDYKVALDRINGRLDAWSAVSF